MTTNQQDAAAIPSQSTGSDQDRLDMHEATSQLLLTVEQAAQKLSVGRSTLYALLQSGRLKSVTVGRLRRVPLDALSEFVESLRDRE